MQPMLKKGKTVRSPLGTGVDTSEQNREDRDIVDESKPAVS